jgi:NADPH-dependent F420 reductase
MNDKQKTSNLTLAILGGTGKEGPGLAMRFARAGYRVIIGSRQAEKAEETAQMINQKLEIDTVSGMENSDAALQADVCILTVVYTAHQSALESLKGALKGKILVDATARIDFRDPRPPQQPSAARTAKQILGTEVRVVAAFQNVPAHTLRRNLDQPLDVDVLVCADDLEAAQTVIDLAQSCGMRAYYAGGLDNSIIVEGLTSLLISINQYYGVKTASIKISGL